MVLCRFFIEGKGIIFFVVPVDTPVAIQIYALALRPGAAAGSVCTCSFNVSIFSDFPVYVRGLINFSEFSEPVDIQYRNYNNLYPCGQFVRFLRILLAQQVH